MSVLPSHAVATDVSRYNVLVSNLSVRLLYLILPAAHNE